MDYSANFWIEHLGLERHIEGGSFNEVYRSTALAPAEGFDGLRNLSTSIYFLLEKGQFSAFHKIKSDEIWHFYAGDSLIVYEIKTGGELKTHLLGPHPEKQESFQCVVAAGSWFASCLANGGEYALAGCTVSPGFDFRDFELADREILSKKFPKHAGLIQSLTRPV